MGPRTEFLALSAPRRLLFSALGALCLALAPHAAGADSRNALDADLRQACAQGETRRVRELLDRGASPKAGSEGSLGDDSPLALAARNGHIEVVELLLQRGADPREGQGALVTTTHARERDDRFSSQRRIAARLCRALTTPHAGWLEAIKNRDAKKARYFLDQGVTPPLFSVVEDLQGWVTIGDYELLAALTPWNAMENDTSCPLSEGLRLALERDDAYLIDRLIDGGILINGTDRGGHTPLYRFAEAGDLRHVMMLVAAGAGVNLVDAQGETALTAGARRKHYAMVKYLLESGARTTAIEPGGRSPLVVAASVGDDEIFSTLLRHEPVTTQLLEEGIEALRIAAETKKYKVLDVLLKHKELGQRSVVERIPLAGVDDDDVLKLLLRAGANPNLPDEDGAVRMHRLPARATIELLLRHGADIDVRTPDGSTPFLSFLIASPGDHEALKFFIDHGADVDARADDGSFALLLTARHDGFLQTTKLLLEAGADPNQTDLSLTTPLMVAARTPEAKATLELLIGAGAHLDQADAAGKTALMHAAETWTPRNSLRLEILVRAGADQTVVDHEGKAAVDYFNPLYARYEMLTMTPIPEGDLKLLTPPSALSHTPDQDLDRMILDGVFKMTWLGRRVDLDEMIPSLLAADPRAVVYSQQARNGRTYPILKGFKKEPYKPEMVRYVGFIPLADDTLALQVEGSTETAGSLLFVMRSTLRSIRPLAEEDPPEDEEWDTEAAESASPRPEPSPPKSKKAPAKPARQRKAEKAATPDRPTKGKLGFAVISPLLLFLVAMIVFRIVKSSLR